MDWSPTAESRLGVGTELFKSSKLTPELSKSSGSCLAGLWSAVCHTGGSWFMWKQLWDPGCGWTPRSLEGSRDNGPWQPYLGCVGALWKGNGFAPVSPISLYLCQTTTAGSQQRGFTTNRHRNSSHVQAVALPWMGRQVELKKIREKNIHARPFGQ